VASTTPPPPPAETTALPGNLEIIAPVEDSVWVDIQDLEGTMP